MPCQPCATIRKHYKHDPQAYRMHCHGCIACGARLIQKIQRLYAWPAEKKQAECRQVLAEWIAKGHSEIELRQLAKMGAWAVADAPAKR